MARFLIAPAAERDMEQIMKWTQHHFGDRARKQYESLQFQAIRDVSKKPDCVGAQVRPEIGEQLRTYHLWNSRNRVTGQIQRVKAPRHFLLFRVCVSGQIEICRVLHDSMDLSRDLPEDSQEGSADGHHE